MTVMTLYSSYLSVSLQKAANAAAAKHSELLHLERCLRDREEELKRWKDSRMEQGCMEIRVRITVMIEIFLLGFLNL
jgi:hypothetical protein